MPSTRFAFTGAKLTSLPVPKESRACYYDATLRGLMFEITPKGTKSFRVYRKFRGRPLKITLGNFDASLPETREIPAGAEPLDLLGHCPALNLRMARKLALAVMAELDTGVNPAESRRGITLGELFARYAKDRRREGKRNVDGLTWMWQRYLGQLPDEPPKPHGAKRTKAHGAVNWENRRLAEIDHPQVSRLRLDLAEKVGQTTSNRVMELLHALYSFARKQRLYDGDNPAAGAGEFKLISRERFLQQDEAPRFFKALDQFDDKDFADYVRLSLFTGARRNNVLRMRWDELNLEGARWIVTGEFMKNGEPLTIHLVNEAIDILQRRAKNATDNPWVFSGDTAAGHMGPQRKKWLQLVTAAKAPDLRIHDLRRSLGSWMSSTGANTVLTMRALGHKSINAALIYQRLAADPVRGAMQTAVSAMMKAAHGRRDIVVISQKRKARERR